MSPSKKNNLLTSLLEMNTKFQILTKVYTLTLDDPYMTLDDPYMNLDDPWMTFKNSTGNYDTYQVS